MDPLEQMLKTNDAALVTTDVWRQQLEHHIRELMDQDLPRLWRLLYRLDVAEQPLRQSLQNNPLMPQEAIIAEAIISRLQQTIISRATIQTPRPGPEEPDAW